MQLEVDENRQVETAEADDFEELGTQNSHLQSISTGYLAKDTDSVVTKSVKSHHNNLHSLLYDSKLIERIHQNNWMLRADNRRDNWVTNSTMRLTVGSSKARL